ncbi:MAG: hypothetical protein IKC69_07560 [Clostridia bacterium]|nr:hypothetical protein [Clostridia bacterium]
MKRLLAVLLATVLSLGTLASCGVPALKETDKAETEEKTSVKNEQKTTEEQKTEEVKSTEEEKKTEEEKPVETPTNPTHPLNGKKVIFVGNSYTYYGNCVLTKNVSVRQQSQRTGDKGYFYQLCKSEGAEVAVTNWTFGSHGLADLFINCGADRGCNGVKHKNDLKDANYDYVFLQERTGEEITPEKLLENVDAAVSFFRAANPDVKIFFFVQHRVYEWNVQWYPAVQKLADRGVTVIEWGKLVNDVITGKTAVPGATQTYDKNSFVINQSADDGYHPNPLSGYVTAAMAYCAITGESAVGLEYKFATDAKVLSAFNPSTYIARYYKHNGGKTNFVNIFGSEQDMRGLQTLMDQYR